MTPNRLLRLWRERWGKGSDNLPDRPYARGAVHTWMHRLPRSPIWSWPLFGSVLITLCALFIFFATQIEFPLNGQITFGAILVAMGLFARRFAGHLFTLLLINLGTVAAISYFHWRLSRTLVFRNRTELLLSMALCLVEMAWALYVVVRAVNTLNEPKAQTQLERENSRMFMGVKRALSHLQTLLRFYSPVARAMLLLLPAIILIGDIRLINVRADFALVFAFPYLALLAMIHDRSDPIRRWGSLRVVRELILAMYVPVLMALAFVRASLSDPALFLRRSFGAPRIDQLPAHSLLGYALIVLNGVALCEGVVQVLARGAAQGAGVRSGYLVFCALAAANLVLLLARQAIVHEARHVLAYLDGKAHLPVTLTFASGHTLRGRTNNFPNEALEIDLPCELSRVEPGPWDLQFQYDHHSVNLSINVSKIQGRRIVVRIDTHSEPVFMRLRDDVLSRDWDWPAWLAHQNADRILPPWLHERLSKLPIWFIDTSTRLAGALRVDQLYLLFKK
jgi:hypothetical protein